MIGYQRDERWEKEMRATERDERDWKRWERVELTCCVSDMQLLSVTKRSSARSRPVQLLQHRVVNQTYHCLAHRHTETDRHTQTDRQTDSHGGQYTQQRHVQVMHHTITTIRTTVPHSTSASIDCKKCNNHKYFLTSYLTLFFSLRWWPRACSLELTVKFGAVSSSYIFLSYYLKFINRVTATTSETQGEQI